MYPAWVRAVVEDPPGVRQHRLANSRCLTQPFRRRCWLFLRPLPCIGQGSLGSLASRACGRIALLIVGHMSVRVSVHAPLLVRDHQRSPHDKGRPRRCDCRGSGSTSGSSTSFPGGAVARRYPGSCIGKRMSLMGGGGGGAVIDCSRWPRPCAADLGPSAIELHVAGASPQPFFSTHNITCRGHASYQGNTCTQQVRLLTLSCSIAACPLAQETQPPPMCRRAGSRTHVTTSFRCIRMPVVPAQCGLFSAALPSSRIGHRIAGLLEGPPSGTKAPASSMREVRGGYRRTCAHGVGGGRRRSRRFVVGGAPQRVMHRVCNGPRCVGPPGTLAPTDCSLQPWSFLYSIGNECKPDIHVPSLGCLNSNGLNTRFRLRNP